MLAMTEPDQRIGRLVDDRYRIIDAMAAGSMGAVYKAERVPVGKLVAIKFLHASFANDSEFLTRFERETQVMSKLAHPNCVSVVDFGVWEHAPYLVMDFVGGRTLRSIIDDGPLEAPRALSIARQIATGLAHAHVQEVVHRDVKPANIMLSEEIGTGERVRILDFGLARLRGSSAAGGRDATQTNVVVGTPNYMAPEQTVGGGTVDARTDIYAAGVVLYEMLTGEKPFQTEETLQLLGMHRAAPIPRLVDRMPRGMVLPAGVQDIIDTAMAKQPADRYQTAIEMAEAIGAVLDDLGGGRPTGELKIPVSSAVRTPRSAASIGVAPTMLDVDNDDELDQSRSPSRPWRAPILGAMILFGGIAAGAGYLIHRGATERADAAIAIGATDAPTVVDPGPGSDLVAKGSDVLAGSGTHEAGSGSAGSGSGSALETTVWNGGGSDVGSGSGVGSGSNSGSGSGSGIAAGSGSAGSGSGAGSGVGSGSDSDVEMDPTKADDPNPNPASATAVDEASDAPTSKEDIEKRAPVQAQPVLAKTVNEAIQQIKDGKRELALASLRGLWKSQPKSAYIPFLLGNLYFDKLWWAVAMEHYKAAIAINPAYKKNQILNQNVIRTLASTKTQRGAQSFLRFTIGAPSVPFLKYAAQHEPNATVKKQAAALAKVIR